MPFFPNLCGEKSAWRKSLWNKNDKYEVWQIDDRHSDSVASTCAVPLTQVVRWRASQVGTSWTRTTSTRRQARNSSEPLDLEHTHCRATGTISTSSLSMPLSGSQALLFTLGITSCRCGTTNFEIRFQVLLHKFNSLFFRTFWLRTSSQKTVIVWLFLRRCWLKGWSAIRPSILMQRIWWATSSSKKENFFFRCHPCGAVIFSTPSRRRRRRGRRFSLGRAVLQRGRCPRERYKIP